MEKGSADILLLNMIMHPVLDGLETYQQILKRHPGQKAVVASGYSETEHARQIMALGVRTYVNKPDTIQALDKAIRETLDS